MSIKKYFQLYGLAAGRGVDDSLVLFVFSIDSAQFRICENLSFGEASELS